MGLRTAWKMLQNLYVYRNGAVHFDSLLNSDASASLKAINVSPDGSHAAFLTKARLTSFANGGFIEMYTFDPSNGEIVCVSCVPNGDPPTANVGAAQNGLFMANDGRAFFYTSDPLVAKAQTQGPTCMSS